MRCHRACTVSPGVQADAVWFLKKRLENMYSRLFGRLLLVLTVALPGYVVAGDDEPEIEIGYHALKPSIVSNLTGGPRYIRCDVQLMTEYASELPKIELHEPALRHTILMLIAGQDGNQLKSREGKESFRMAALDAVQQQLKTLTGKTLVNDLYFTNYYVK
jgi:flagellar FliL protein